MWTLRISSETREYPTPKDVIRALLSQMIGRGVESAWTHFEVVAEGGWFRNLLHGREPWVEIACVNKQFLQLNLGVLEPERPLVIGIPEKWPQRGKGLWAVPADDGEELIEWVNNYLAAVSENSSYRLSGWIEGL